MMDYELVVNESPVNPKMVLIVQVKIRLMSNLNLVQSTST